MSVKNAQQESPLTNDTKTFDPDGRQLSTPPTFISRNCTSQDFVIDNPDSPEKYLSKCHGATINANDPLLRNQQPFEVNLEMRNGNQSETSSSSFVKCLETSTKQIKLQRTGSSCHSICGPSPKKIIRWVFIFVLAWVTFTIVINMHKKVSKLK